MDCHFISWCALSAEAQAAWAQAILSALGIAVVPLIIRWSDRRKLASSLAFSLYEDLVTIEGRLDSYYAFGNHEREDREAMEAELDHPGVKAIFELPANLRLVARELHNLGEFGGPARLLFKALIKGKEIFSIREIVRQMGHDRPDETAQLLAAIKDVGEATKQLRKSLLPDEKVGEN